MVILLTPGMSSTNGAIRFLEAQNENAPGCYMLPESYRYSSLCNWFERGTFPTSLMSKSSYTASTLHWWATMEIQVSSRLAACSVRAVLRATERLVEEGLSASRYRFWGKGRWRDKNTGAFSFNLFVSQCVSLNQFCK